MTTHTKTVVEKLKLSRDFSELLGTGNTIVSITSVSAEDWNSGASKTSDIIASPAAAVASNTKVVYWVGGGVAGTNYLLRIKVVSSTGETLEGQEVLRVVSALRT